MPDPDRPDTQPRVSCPACGKRFRVDVAQIQGAAEGAGVRCRSCGESFRIRIGRDGQVKIVTGKRRRPRRAEAPATRGAPPPESVLHGVEEAFLAPAGMGERIGRYEVEALLGRGGMAAVYRAFDPAANRHVALKVLSSDAPPEDIVRFRREVEVQGNIQHPHIMPIFDSGTLGRSRYFAMELLKDPLSLQTLARLVREGHAARDPLLRPLSTLEGMLRHVMLPICEAVHHANAREGVIHRDLKPDNVLIDRNGLRPFVIDFGICSLTERKNQRLAHLPPEGGARIESGGIRVTGTLVYMPPEQARGEVDRRGDVWALGAILHFLITGAPPLTPASRGGVRTADRIEGLKLLIEQAEREEREDEVRLFREKLSKVESGRERDLVALQRDVLAGRYLPLPSRTPRPLRAIITKAMAPEPEHRYRHALELRADLLRWLGGKPTQAVTRSLDPVRGLTYRAGLLARRHPWAAALLAAGGIAAAWTAAALLAPGRTGPDDAQKSAYLRAAKEGLETGASLGKVETSLRQALADCPTSEEALGLLSEVRARRRLDRALARVNTLALAYETALEARREEEALRLLARLKETYEQQVDPGLGIRVPQSVRDEADRLAAVARGDREVVLRDAPEGLAITAFPRGAGGAREDGRDLGAGSRLPFGAWVLRLRRRDGELWLPVAIRAARGPVEIVCPIDPAEVPSGWLYVLGGRVDHPLEPTDVAPLLWERLEVTNARYAAWLHTLAPEEQRRRVPRRAGTGTGPGEPLWAYGAEGFLPPADAASRPVESISVHDAQAFASAQGARLPSAAEWAWAATAGGPHLTAVGSLDRLPALGIRVASSEGASVDVGSTPADRSPFGIRDLAGNVREMTGTRTTWRDVRGWLVMGGGYQARLTDALVTEPEAVDGREALPGVGIRLVRAVP